jgi:hypothetical protein
MVKLQEMQKSELSEMVHEGELIALNVSKMMLKKLKDMIVVFKLKDIMT